MPPEIEDRASLFDMLVFAREAMAFARGRKRVDLDRDRGFLRSLERVLELIGEAARRISLETQEAYPAIPWKDIIGMRNIIAHEYGKVDLDEIWKTMQEDVPRLVATLEELVSTLPIPE
jgi:uncharacterized protein with HEPN domain